MGITEDDMRKPSEAPGFAVELRAGATRRSNYWLGKAVVSETVTVEVDIAMALG